ncbi:MAG: hypothetical protein KUG78_11435 [Kangiellaceae bacterium]|nr:hypothetical protein [Kangiellaceae bacterium]
MNSNKNMKSRLIIAIPLLLVSPWAHAAEMVSWKSYLFVVMAIALIGGIILSRRSKKAEGRAAKIILAGLYFWVITFAELIVLALIYHFTQE